jgi:hypothetical protein
METIVPLAAAGVKGPLGVAHLPRLWLKAVLAAATLLPADYSSGYGGTDRDLLDGIGLDGPATFAYLAAVPSYQAFEAWVRVNARNFDAASVAAVNAKITGHQKPPEKAALNRAQLGLGDTGERRTALLNALDDWASVHADVVARRGQHVQSIVPAVSSQSFGPLGLVHLPRFWMKATLSATGALYPGWVSAHASGFDRAFGATVGLDLDAAVAHVRADLPSYPQFEAWFVAQVAHVEPADVERYNAALLGRIKPADIAAVERAILGIDDPAFSKSVDINDLIDWHTLHEICVQAAQPERSLT